MSMEDRALAARQEAQDEQRERAHELDRLRDEEVLAATLVATASETLRREWRDVDPPEFVYQWRDRVDQYVTARDTADAYQREHGL
ncbi:hypothetical protein [Sanguibacter sp. HDW7]|uniref:hypothetical protein n=1 Tax=Sanguibacter sp. HDW7 TaxID=2714931 RepID=UPI00140D6CFF|nr:hypothetical protein [Sanguibacter sp. HDW7]QIK82428.1 hypothetical protein G7063_01460 [Sanguibacter sp. HDW7]